MVQVIRKFGQLIDDIDWSDVPRPEDLPVSTFRQPRRVAASGIKDCSRQWYYKLNQEYQPFARENTKPEWNIAAAYGNWIHEKIQNMLIEYDLIDNTEVYLPDRGNFISGRRDGNLKGERCLLEIKTVSGAHWSKFPHNDKFLGYQDQIQTYLEELDLPEALLICVRRDPIVEGRAHNIRKTLCKEFIITRDRQEGQRLIAKAKNIQDHLERQVVPMAEPNDGCFFCAYQHLCQLQDIRDSISAAQRYALG